MALMVLRLPPGFHRNGTPRARKDTYEHGNLVRYEDGSVRPIGGWTRRRDVDGELIAGLISDSDLEAIRDSFAWRSNNQQQQIVFGSNLALYHMDQDGTTTDITYAGYAALNSSKDPSTAAGYGQNPYGVGEYGVPNNLTGGDTNPVDRWYFDNFGEVLLTGAVRNGGIYELDLGTLTLSVVSNAPDQNQDLCVTNERQVMAVGTQDEPRRVQTSDVEDYDTWTPAVDNQCIDRVIPGTGRLLRCVPVLNQVLIVGETDAHVARYIGPPYIYSITLAGEKCGPIDRKAISTTDRFAVWWGDRKFWIFDGSVKELPCAVIDFLYNDLDSTQNSKIVSFSNTQHNEIWWLYQSTSTTTTEVDSYVAWDHKNNAWYTGRLNRTSGIDKGVTASVLMVDPDGQIFNHELEGVFPPSGDVYIETNVISLGMGEKNFAVQRIYPDVENGDGLQITLKGREMPDATVYEYGPYDFNRPIDTRAMGRMINFRVDFSDASQEWGTSEVEYSPMGTGKR
jgi:hypothetical protein